MNRTQRILPMLEEEVSSFWIEGEWRRAVSWKMIQFTLKSTILMFKGTAPLIFLLHCTIIGVSCVSSSSFDLKSDKKKTNFWGKIFKGQYLEQNIHLLFLWYFGHSVYSLLYSSGRLPSWWGTPPLVVGPIKIIPEISIYKHYLTPKNVKMHLAPFQTQIICQKQKKHK